MTVSEANPLLSAAVILLDETRGGEEPFGVFLLRRTGGNSFMPGRYVFPGGKAEGKDCRVPVGDLRERLCALRELVEETGVYLGGSGSPDPEQVLNLIGLGGHPIARAALPLFWTRGLDCLIPHARWITPRARAQRFDTTFFLCVMPPNQEARADERETTSGLWLGPRAALAKNQAGEVRLAPPQVRIIGGLSRYQSLEALLRNASSADLSPVEPELYIGEEERVVLLPGDPDYARGEPQTLAVSCHAQRATRLVNREGIWLPFRARG